MISVIVCSRESILNQEFRDNISDTIGTNYELVVIDNSENRFDIYEAYNHGIKLCSGLYICFVHDDVRFFSCNWGLFIESVFTSSPEIGLLGVSGSSVKTRMPSSWWGCDSRFHVQNLLQDYPSGESIYLNCGFDNSDLVDVVTIDGVFMALRNDPNAFFDCDLRGFHNYDIYLAYKYFNDGYRVVVTNDILIQHFSLGNIDSSWYESSYNLYKKIKHDLPMVTKALPFGVILKNEWVNYCNFIKSSKTSIPFWSKIELTWDLFCFAYLNCKINRKIVESKI